MDPAQSVQIVEVGPRDGLQNESRILATDSKVAMVEALVRAGLKRIEIGSFVSAKQVAQMADSAEVFRRLPKHPDVSYSALVANQRGLDTAVRVGVREIAVFAAASETFSEKNIHCSIADSLVRYRDVAGQALGLGMRVRGYVSCVLGCPYEGHVRPESVAFVALNLFAMGCFEVSLGDTIGAGTPESTSKLLEILLQGDSPERFAVHFHDTGGRAMDNIEAALKFGIRVIDSSIGGLGGCPFAPGSPGNVATERVASALHARGFETGLDEAQLKAVAQLAADMLGKSLVSSTQADCE
ncbi:MAG: hydroxymethylglutaryl-CoA lyase [Bryobacteraceae bacterium]